ncbi:MAG: hypothetical protein ACRD4S_12285 [Candidatus Acidiferrales bacterium]
MNSETHLERGTSRTGIPLCLGRIIVFVLLVAVAMLSTFAKDSLYLPTTNAVHYVNISSKMQDGHATTAVDLEPAQPVANVLPYRPRPRIVRRPRSYIPPVPSTGAVVSLQHRSPPTSFF